MADNQPAAAEPQPAGLARLDRWLDDRLGLDRLQPHAAVVIVLFVQVLALSLRSANQGWHNPLLDLHDFRQTQTAITVQSMLNGGPWLAYEIPVFGPPWSLPFELPVFQWIVAGLVRISGWPIDQTGRLVSLAFFYLSLIPAYSLLGRLNIRPSHRLIFLTLILASPLYAFWSRTFMIESCALFFCLAFVALLAGGLESGSRWRLALAAAVGAIGALVKITTFFGFLLAAGLMIFARGYTAWRAQRIPEAWRRELLPAVIAASLAVIPNNLWTAFADSVKAMNPIGALQTSEKLLAGWILGPLSLRFSDHLWRDVVFQRMMPDILGYPFLLLLLLPMLLYVAIRWRRAAGLAAACGALFLAPVLVFTNLHEVHNYYQYANGVFLLACVGFMVDAFLRGGTSERMLGLFLLCLFAGIGVLRFRSAFLPVQRADTSHSPLMQTALSAQGHTSLDETLVIVGFDWDPVFAYYAERRALMLPGWLEWESPAFQQALANLGTGSIGAFMVCRGERDEPGEVAGWLADLGMASMPAAGTELCDIYLPEGDGGVAAGWP